MAINFDDLIDYLAYYSEHVGKAKLQGDQLVGLCPFHPEKNPSFSVNIKTGQWICRSGCGSGNIINFHARINNISEEEALRDLTRKYGTIKTTPRSSRKKDPSTIPIETLAKFKDIPKAPLNYAITKRGWSKEIILKHQIGFVSEGKRPAYAIPIFDETGALVNIRTYAPETETKILSWKKGFGSSRLFPLSVLQEARESGSPVILCEGEPDALCGLSHGLYCITHTTGADNWHDPFNVQFKGLDVVIAYDNDEAGRKGARRVCRHLPLFAKSVSLITWPDWMQDKEDLTDWFVRHKKTKEEFLALPAEKVEAGENGNPSEKADIEQRLQKLNKEYSVVMLGGKCLVMKQVVDPIFGRNDVTFSGFNDFRNFHSNEKYWVENGH